MYICVCIYVCIYTYTHTHICILACIHTKKLTQGHLERKTLGAVPILVGSTKVYVTQPQLGPYCCKLVLPYLSYQLTIPVTTMAIEFFLMIWDTLSYGW